jgi:hypothetical protein
LNKRVHNKIRLQGNTQSLRGSLGQRLSIISLQSRLHRKTLLCAIHLIRQA